MCTLKKKKQLGRHWMWGGKIRMPEEQNLSETTCDCPAQCTERVWKPWYREGNPGAS